MSSDTLPHEILLDNTVFTAATRALRAHAGKWAIFDFLALIDLTQSLVCYEHLLQDATSRRRPEEQASWQAATEPWARFTVHPIRQLDLMPILADREATLDTAARLALSEATTGKFDAAYRAACAEVGVNRLLPAFYTRDGGPDDERFLRAKEYLRAGNLAIQDSLTEEREALARYVFRGLYYSEFARFQKVSYSPSPLRARLLELSTLGAPPVFDGSQWRAQRLQDGGSADLLTDLGISLKPTSRDSVRMPLVFSYLLTLCEQSGCTIPEAVLLLRNTSEMRDLRKFFEELMGLWHAKQWGASEHARLQAVEREITRTQQAVSKATGETSATATVNPLIAPFSFLKAEDLTLAFKLPRWLFSWVAGPPRVALMWNFFKEGTKFTDLRARFDAYLMRQSL